MHEPPSQALLELKVERFRHGCEDAAVFLRARFLNLAKRCAYKHLRLAEDVDDVVEEALGRMWQRRSSLPGSYDALRVYFLRIVENCVIDFVRRSDEVKAARQGIRRHEGEVPEVSAPNPANDADSVESIVSEAAKDFLETLSAHDRHLLHSVCAHLALTPQPKMQHVYRAVGNEVDQNPLYVRNRWSRVQKGLKHHLGHQIPPKATRLILTVLGEQSGHHC